MGRTYRPIHCRKSTYTQNDKERNIFIISGVREGRVGGFLFLVKRLVCSTLQPVRLA